MSAGRLVSFGAAIASDVLSAFQLPGGSTLGVLVEGHFEKKRAEARDILIAEISDGLHGKVEFDQKDVDPLLDIILRFSKAVSDGVARENLRLLAQVIAGLKRNKALDSDKFRKWAGILEALTRDELIVIGTGISIQREMEAERNPERVLFFQRLEKSVIGRGYSKEEFGALCATVSRTGLFLPVSAFGGLVYMPSPWLDEIGRLADVEGMANSPSR